MCGICFIFRGVNFEMVIMANKELEVLNINNDYSKNDQSIQNIEVIENSNILKEGMFAALKKLTPKLSYDLGTVLLIQELKFADNNLHAVYVRHHPNSADNSKTVGFILDEFYDHFDVLTQSEGEAVRESEIAKIQQRIAYKESEVQDLKDNPKKLQALAFSIYSKRLESPMAPTHINTDNIVNLLGQENALEQINAFKSQTNMFADVAKIQADIIKGCVDELQGLMNKLSPFMVEKYATALATTKEAQESVKEINDGVATLSMYTGDGVELIEIKRGADAAPEVPLTLVQEKILCDVELAYFNDVSAASLSVENIQERFFDVMATNQQLVDQIFPTQRCICIAAIREAQVKLGYKPDPHWRVILDKLNKQTFLLIRNGDNISAVYSPIGSHLAANNLFPSKDVLDKCFFSHDGAVEITVDSLNYSDVLNDIDRLTLHYKRFLILIAGLQHRLNLLGRFYPDNESFGIFFPEFQKKYFNFIHDEDGSDLLGEVAEHTLEDFVWQQNMRLSIGSKLICNTNKMASEEAAPYCWTYSWRRAVYGSDGKTFTRPPVYDYEIVSVEYDKDGYFVRFPVSSGTSNRTQMAKVRIVESRSEIDYLVLDNLNVDLLNNYITKRKYRKKYLEYMGLFKGAKAYLAQFEAENQKNIQYYLNAVEQIKGLNIHGAGLKGIVMSAINFFSPKVTQAKVLNNLYLMLSANEQSKIQTQFSELKFMRDQQYLLDAKAIAIVVDRSGNEYLYTSLPKALGLKELESIEKDYWVYRTPIKAIKNGTFKLDKAEIVSLLDNVRDELVISVVDADLYTYYRDLGATRRQASLEAGKGKMTYNKYFVSYQHKRDFLDAMSFSKTFIEAFYSNQVTREMVTALQAKIKDQREDLKGDQFDRWGNALHKELILCLPFSISHHLRLGAICLKDGLNWLDRLAERYEQTASNLIEQDNHSQTIGVIKQDFHRNEADKLFTKAFDIDQGSNSFVSVNLLQSQYTHSTKLLSYVLHSTSHQVLKADYLFEESSPDVLSDTRYSVFGIEPLLKLDTSLDAVINNPYLPEVVPVIQAYHFEVLKKDGQETISYQKHQYIGEEHYLNAFINDLKRKIQADLDQLEGKEHGEIRFDRRDEKYICSTGDFEQFKKDIAGSVELEFNQITPHIFGRIIEKLY